MWENTLNPEQTAEIKERGEQLGAEKIREVEDEWKQLIAGMKKEMEAGTDPKDPAGAGAGRAEPGAGGHVLGREQGGRVQPGGRVSRRGWSGVRARCGADGVLGEGGAAEAPGAHVFTRPFLTMLLAAATIASRGSRAVQPRTRRAFSLDIFFA